MLDQDMGRLFGTVFFAAFFFFSTAQAYETEDFRGYLTHIPGSEDPIPPRAPHPYSKRTIANGNRLRKFQLALDALKIPHEPVPDFSDFPLENEIAQPELIDRLKYIDPDDGLRRYLKIEATAISIFRDFFSSLLPRNLLEYSLALKPSGPSEDSASLLAHLQTIASQVQNPRVQNPLTGMKIVIDPGHMGTAFWDQETGKFVEVNGVKVSEGQLNLWTALLTANALEELGAKVVLTRTQDGPVSPESLQSFNSAPYINQYFYNSIDDWMAPYLEKLSDTAISTTIWNKPEVKQAYTSKQRSILYISGEDLEARSAIIDREQPHLVLDIHYDANNSHHLQSQVNSVEAFVPGAFRDNETGSRKIRAYALKHLLEIQRWNESVALAGEITSSVAESAQLPLLDSPTFMTAVKVQDGVYARNLYINRRNLSALTVYLECLHYDHTDEFSQLAQNTQVGNYHGMSFRYPSRLTSVVSGIRAGILKYFKR